MCYTVVHVYTVVACMVRGVKAWNCLHTLSETVPVPHNMSVLVGDRVFICLNTFELLLEVGGQQRSVSAAMA